MVVTLGPPTIKKPMLKFKNGQISLWTWLNMASLDLLFRMIISYCLGWKLKTLFSIPEESTEKSQFTSGAILDESACSG
jgi:hypothetical protein